MPRPVIGLGLAAAVLLILGFLALRPHSARDDAPASASPSEQAPVADTTPAADTTPPASPPPGPPVVQDRPLVLRPLAVAKETELHAWSAEDARDPEVIRRIAHNEWEERRMLEENPRITGRQLVYRKEPVFIAVERARAEGRPLASFTLPGFDGRELEVRVTRADLAPSGLGGTLTGRLPGLDESLVTIAFKQGTEAFTIASPEDGTFLQAHPREPGELILSSFEPETYLAIPGGEPIHTHEPVPTAE